MCLMPLYLFFIIIKNIFYMSLFVIVAFCVCVYVCMYVCVCVYVCMYVCMYVCVYIQVHLNKLECCGKVHLFQ